MNSVPHIAGDEFLPSHSERDLELRTEAFRKYQIDSMNVAIEVAIEQETWR